MPIRRGSASTVGLRKFFPTRSCALVEIRVSQINGCACCLDLHTTGARHPGASQQRLEQRLDCPAAWHEAPFFSGCERAALACAEAVTRIAESRAPDEVYAEVKKHFSDKELMDLTVVIAMINAWNRLSVAFRSEPIERRPDPLDKSARLDVRENH
ncbi:MAG TPA: carboxymuconolactone decarboxylase family protein [Verrucomicrobiae bacterium]|nr:carboxymuconolactone decarboxylase family protein [Verrucomicrobiae bacterium]